MDEPDPLCSYSLSIGEVYMCKWTDEEEEDKVWEPQLDLEHRNTLSARSDDQPQTAATHNSMKHSLTPGIMTKRVCFPFEFRFINQDVKLEVRDMTDNLLLFEV